MIKRISMNLHGDQPDYYRLPEDPELAAQYLMVYEMSLPFGHDLSTLALVVVSIMLIFGVA